MSAKNTFGLPHIRQRWIQSGAWHHGQLTELKHSDFFLIHGPVSKKRVKWPVLESRGARTGFDEQGRPVSEWGTPVPKLEIRFGKMAFRGPNESVVKCETTFIAEVHYWAASEFHSKSMTHPLGSFGSMTCFDFADRAKNALKSFLLERNLRQAQEQLTIPFVRVVCVPIPAVQG